MKPPRPMDPIVRSMMTAVQQHQAGRLDDAERIYRQVLSKQPRNPDALHLLGLIEHQRGRNEQAASLIERAAQYKPGEATFLVNLGQVYRALQRLDDADACLRRAIQLNPRAVDAHANLAAVLRAKKQLAEAETAAWTALAINPRFGPAHMNLGNILKDRGDTGAAIACFEQALQFGAPRHEVLSNLGDALRTQGHWESAQATLEEAIRIHPEMAAAHWNLSLLYLLRGDLSRGFAEYEWRLRQPGAEARRFDQPRWDGADLNGRTILLHTEQGFGDAIQFIRYAPLVAQRGGRVIVECQPQLARLLRGVAGIVEVVERLRPLPHFDVHAPLLSLPYLFRSTLETLPREAPYLKPEPELLARWRERIVADPGVRKVGLVWAGNPAHVNDRNRSIPLEQLAPLAEVENVRWFSLQFGAAAQQPRPVGLELVDLSERVSDFADSAAIVSLLDLLITVDSAPAHLAGALARPVWTLLPAFPDWRWLLDREDSVWYPTMRLFRRRENGDWQHVVREVVAALNADAR